MGIGDREVLFAYSAYDPGPCEWTLWETKREKTLYAKTSIESCVTKSHDGPMELSARACVRKNKKLFSQCSRKRALKIPYITEQEKG